MAMAGRMKQPCKKALCLLGWLFFAGMLATLPYWGPAVSYIRRKVRRLANRC